MQTIATATAAGADAPAGFGLTGKAKLYLALKRLDLDAVPDELAGRLADVVNTIAREHPAQPKRCPLVGRITA